MGIVPMEARIAGGNTTNRPFAGAGAIFPTLYEHYFHSTYVVWYAPAGLSGMHVHRIRRSAILSLPDPRGGDVCSSMPWLVVRAGAMFT